MRLTAPVFPERSRLASLERPLTLDHDHFRRVATQTGPAYFYRDPPEGISSLGYLSLPSGLTFAVEGNLTSVLYGSEAKAGNLTEDELAPALARLVDVGFEAVDGAGYPYPRARLLQVSRMDTSVTRVLPPSVPVHEFVRTLAAHELRTWKPGKKGNRFSVAGSNGLTATHGTRGGDLYLRGYEKTAEAHANGHPCPPNVFRAEAERRPRQRPYLEELDVVLETAHSDADRIGKWVAEATAETNLVAAQALRDGMVALGEADNPAEALRLCGAASVLASKGIAGLVDQGGISRSTAYRIEKRIETLMVAATGGKTLTAMEQAYDSATALLARDLVASAETELR